MSAPIRFISRPPARYAIAVAAVVVAVLLRQALLLAVGELPTYITFYPAVMLAALLAGLGPGLLATLLAAMAADYWFIPPYGSFSIARPADMVSLGLFSSMGVLMSVMAELYGRARRRVAVYEKALAIREEHARAARKIQQQKEQWEQTFHSVPDLIAILDRKHRVVRVNQPMAKRLDREPEECVGLSCFQAIHGTQCQPAACPHALTLIDGKEHTAEVYEERLGGHFLVSTSPLSDAEGRLIGSVHVARNITERKRREEQLRQLNHILKALSKSNQALMRATDEARLPPRGLQHRYRGLWPRDGLDRLRRKR